MTQASAAPEGGSTTSSTVAPERLELAVFEGESTLRFLARHKVPPSVLLLIPVVAITAMAIISSAEHRFTMNGLSTAWCHDMAHRLILRPKWSCLRHPELSPAFPLLRDAASLVAAVILAGTPYLMYRQWLGMRDLYPTMMRRGVLQFASAGDSESAFLGRLDEVNNYFTQAGRRSVIQATTAMLCILLAVMAERQGLYPSLAPTSLGEAARSTWTRNAYSTWWANFDSGTWGWLIYVLIGYCGIYYIITMNIIGGRVVIFIWRTRKLVTYGADPENRDGYFGWLQARKILAPTYTAVALHGVCLYLIATMVPRSALWFLLPVMGQWLITLPFYMFVPLSITWRSISSFKKRESQRIVDIIDSLPSDPVDVDAQRDRELWAQRLERVRSIRELPFRRTKDVAISVVTAVATIASLYGAAALWYNIT